MKCTHVRLVFVLVAMMMLIWSDSYSLELDEHLQFLGPFLGKEWVGGFVGEDAPDLEISLLFEAILDGKVVRYSREAEEADFASVTHFYWNPKLAEVSFISLNNRGIVEEGTVTGDGDAVVLHGSSYRLDMTVEFKTALTLDAEGTLKDSFLRKEGEEWIQGHTQKFTVR